MSGQSWLLTPHCCRRCFGRVLETVDTDGGRVWRCSQCGHSANGDDASSVCCCGIRLRDGRDANVRCVVNEERTPECPFEVVAEQVPM